MIYLANRIDDGVKASCSIFSEQCLEFGKRHFDWIEIRRIGRQEQQPCPARPNQLRDLCAFVEGDIIEDDNIARRKCWRQLGFDIGLKDLFIHRRIDKPGRGQTTGPQTCNERLCLPAPKRSICVITRAAGRPARALR